MRWISQESDGLYDLARQSSIAAKQVFAKVIVTAVIMAALTISLASVGIAQHDSSPRTAKARKASEFDVARIDDQAVREFQAAWRRSASGVAAIEAVVLIFRKPDGSYMATSLRQTNEYQRFAFAWNPAAIAIVHTHPNACSPRPTPQDIDVADKYDVPVITITCRGMFMYDPATKRVTRVQEGLDWLKPDKWTRKTFVASNK